MQSPCRELPQGARQQDTYTVKSPRSSPPKLVREVGGCVFRVKEKRMLVRVKEVAVAAKRVVPRAVLLVSLISGRRSPCVFGVRLSTNFFVFFSKN